MKKFVRTEIIPLIYRFHQLIFKKHYIKMVKLLVPNLFNSKKEKLGRDGDGTYILPISLLNDSGVLLSFGVADDTSFEEDFIEKYPNISIYTFDPSIDSLPSTNSKIHFDKIGVAGKKSSNGALLTFDQIIQQKNISKKEQIVIKMDIEGWEWGVFKGLNFEEYNIPVIVIEFHMMTINSISELLFFPIHFYNRLKTINRILDYYYILHEHANNYQYTFFKNFTFPWLIEVTLVRKSLYFNDIQDDIRELNQINCENKADFQYPFFK
jgi:hypothetical protein